MSLYQENGVNKVTDEFKIKRIKSHYREFFPLGEEVESKNVMKIVGNECGKLNLFIADKDYRNPAFLATQLKIGKLNRFLSFNAQEVVDIYLGNSEIYKSVSNIRTDYLFLSLGYGEIENKRIEEILLSLIDVQVSSNKVVNIFIKGSNLINTKYRNLYAELLSRKFTIVDLNKGHRVCKAPPSSKPHMI